MITPSNFVAHAVAVSSASGWASALRARESQISNLKSQMTDLLVALAEEGNLSPEQRADLIAYLESLH